MEIQNVIERYEYVKRGEDLTITPVSGLYNQPLFDLCADDALMSFVLMNGYNAALDAIGFETSNVYRLEQNMLTYIGAAGAAAGTPNNSDQTDPCGPGTGTEFGGVNWVVEGWGRLRRTSDPRDITDVVTKYCLKTPILTIGGERIEDDYEWDQIQLTNVILQDYQRRVINGNAAVGGQADGLEQLITYGYTDPITGELATSMDATVIDYAENAMCPGTDGATDVTFNGNAVADGSNLYAIISSFLRRVRVRINNSPNLIGTPKHIGLLSSEHLNTLIECYVCHTTCAGDQAQMMEAEVKKELDALKGKWMTGGSITLSFHGVPVTFFPYDYGLISSTTPESDGTIFGDMYILTTDVGSTPLMRLQVKDMRAAANHEAMSGVDLEVTDNSRFLSWKTYDHICFRSNVEMQYRWRIVAPWAQMRITNVASTPLLGAQVADPLSEFFWEANKVAYPKATVRTFQTFTAPVAVDQFYTRATGAAVMNVVAANGLLRGSTGVPNATAVPVVSAATTAGGTITINADGSFTYNKPTNTYAGNDTYTFTLTNAQGTDTGVVTITSFTAAA